MTPDRLLKAGQEQGDRIQKEAQRIADPVYKEGAVPERFQCEGSLNASLLADAVWRLMPQGWAYSNIHVRGELVDGYFSGRTYIYMKRIR